MQQQPLWIVIVAPAATLLAVLIERVFSYLAKFRQQELAARTELRQFALALLREELKPILEYADQSAVLARDVSLTYLRIQQAMQARDQLVEERDIALWDKLHLQVDELRKLSDMAYSRAHSLTREVSDAVFAVHAATMEVYQISNEYFRQWNETGKTDISNDDIRETSQALFEESGRLRKLCREYLITTFEDGVIPKTK